jgi:4'-phosphopantetheinyl transferase
VTRALPPPPGVDVWWFDSRTVAVGPADTADLDSAERSRAGAFLFDADRHRYQVAHVMLRRVLAAYLRTRPAGLTFRRELCPRCGEATGRPALGPCAGRPVPCFSLAHSGDMVVIAVAGRPVGVDVERAPAACVCSLAGVLHGDDAGVLARMPEPARHEAVITCWVRAEAVLKCSGEGIAHGLGRFPVWAAGAGAHAVHGCAVSELGAPPGYRAAIALAGAGGLTPRAVAGPPPALCVPGNLDDGGTCDAEV